MIHLYTGNGKGKTTAALGLAIRAAGNGMRVFIGQFVKGMPYSELAVIENLPLIELQQFGRDCFIKHEPEKADVDTAQYGWKHVQKMLTSLSVEVLILDELCIALYYKLLDLNEVIETLQDASSKLEIIITGRYAPDELIALADLVTEMKAIKHYYEHGIEARKGIEY